VRAAVLLLLAEEPMHGYQLMQTIAERTGGRWSPSPGAVYPTLSQLEDEGLVSSEKAGGRKLVSLTEEGRSHIEEHRASWPDPFPSAAQSADEEVIDLRELGHGLLGAAREVARSGTDDQVRETAQLLEETRRRIYGILAGEPRTDEPRTDESRTAESRTAGPQADEEQ
jgi:DNA-binding PadR family transcriptional regulator